MMMRFTYISMLISVSMTFNLQVVLLLTWNYVVSLSLSGTEGEEEVFQGNGQPYAHVEFWTAKKTTICRTFGGLLQD
jgi:hypothetical protein